MAISRKTATLKTKQFHKSKRTQKDHPAKGPLSFACMELNISQNIYFANNFWQYQAVK